MRGINIWSRMVLVGVLCLAGGFSAWAGGNERIAILLDPGNNDRENRQMGTRMERDLKNVLDKRGNYESRILRSRDEFKTGDGEYLLAVRIIRYNSGSKAARIIVGFGAGSCSLDIHYELFGPSGNMLLSKDDGCGSSLDWQRLARKLNETMLAAIQARLRAGNLDATVAPAPMAPVAPVQAVAPAVAGDSVEQLRQLDAMKKQRLISESEYKQKRKQILDRL
jgi:hypothetical protein